MNFDVKNRFTADPGIQISMRVMAATRILPRQTVDIDVFLKNFS
jgi:hypothetical protein